MSGASEIAISRRLIVHVGPAKTGTSAVQHYLRSHDDSVAFYPKVGLWADGSHHGLLFNYYKLFNRPDITWIDTAAAIAEIADGARRTGKNVVVSSELFPSVNPRLLVDELLAQLDGDWSAELLFVVREHFERAASVYNQRVKDFAIVERATPDEFIRREIETLTYAPMLAHLRLTGLPLRLMSYHPADDFVARFLADLGFPVGVVSERRNISMSLKGLAATLAANNVAPTQADRARCFAALRRMRQFFGPMGPIFSHEAMMAVVASFDQDRDHIATEFGIELPTPKIPAIGESVFYLSAQQRADINAAAEELGALGQELVSFVEYLSHLPREPRHAARF